MLVITPEANVCGLDYSEVSVATSRDYNAEKNKCGRCKILQGNVSAIPFNDETLDLATAFETVYFWPDLAKCFGEICRVLKPGGTFLIVNEADGEDGKNDKWERIIDMKTYTRNEIADAMTSAGLTKIETFHHENKSWIAVRAKKQ